MQKKDQKKIIAVIPSRYNSTRFPGKLLAKVLGKTVIQRTYESSILSKILDDVYVATDSDKIAKHITSLNGTYIMTSPDCISGTERIIDALKNNHILAKSEIIINIQGDNPCICPKTIDAVVNSLLKDKSADVSTAIAKIDNEKDYLSRDVVKCVFDNSYNALYFSRSSIPHSKDGYKKAFHHIGIYAYRTSFLKKYDQMKESILEEYESLEQLKILENGYKIKVAIVNRATPSVDVPEDILKVERFICQ
jgi:3-deoxy-manno-octulosonate cytidylyltransferase (CMP-KDO synthetase)